MNQFSAFFTGGISATVAGALIGAFLSVPFDPVQAALVRPSISNDMEALDLSSLQEEAFLTHSNLHTPGVPDALIETVLSDDEGRVSEDFQVRKGLRPTIRFWLKVYAQYSSLHSVLYDRKSPDVVYEVLNFEKLWRDSRSRGAYERKRAAIIRREIAAYRRDFRRLRKNPAYRGGKAPLIRKALRNPRHRRLAKMTRQLSKNLRLQTGQRDFIMRGLKSARAHFPLMEAIFEEFRLPIELTRLTLVESSFNPRAHSHAGAVGIWQFMPRSASEYLYKGKKNRLDERYSPLKSTVAAARLLKRNHRIMKNWPLAITAYHSGARNLLRIPRHQRRGHRAEALLHPQTGTRRLGIAGKSYYASFLAILHAIAYEKEVYGHPPVEPLPLIRFQAVRNGKTGKDLAEAHSGLELFRRLNPEIRSLHRPLPEGYLVALPHHENDFDTILSPDWARELEIGKALRRKRRRPYLRSLAKLQTPKTTSTPLAEEEEEKAPSDSTPFRDR